MEGLKPTQWGADKHEGIRYKVRPQPSGETRCALRGGRNVPESALEYPERIRNQRGRVMVKAEVDDEAVHGIVSAHNEQVTRWSRLLDGIQQGYH